MFSREFVDERLRRFLDNSQWRSCLVARMAIVNRGPAFISKFNLIQERLTPNKNKTICRIAVIQEPVSTIAIINDAAVARAFPIVVAREDGICGIFFPRSKQFVRARNAKSIIAPAATTPTA